MTDDQRRSRPPIPTSISPQAQQYLSTPAPFGTDAPPDDPQDVDGWLKYIDARNQVIAARFGSSLAGFPMDEMEIDGVTTYVVRPDDADDTTPIYIDIHGGGLTLCGGEVCRLLTAASAMRRNMITWAVDYRMPPLHPYPAALDDCIALYRRALEERAPEDIFVGGGSAGGNLAAALLARAKDEGLPMPRALVLLTPEVDLTESGDSFHTILGLDIVLRSLMKTNLLYANGHDLAHPYLSPLFADLTGFPPTFLQSGTRDLFLSNTVRMHRALRAAGVEADLHIFEAMPHAGFGGTAPEDAELAGEVRQFLDKHRRDTPASSN